MTPVNRLSLCNTCFTTQSITECLPFVGSISCTNDLLLMESYGKRNYPEHLKRLKGLEESRELESSKIKGRQRYPTTKETYNI